jgi:predicted nucleic acid-binding protein
VEVAAALWRKHRTGELDLDTALLLNRDFTADYAGTPERPPRFEPVEVTDTTIERAVEMTGTHGLRAYDAVQLACALSIREVDKRCTTLATFDRNLARAAAAEGFVVLPPAETAEAQAP